MTDFAPSLTDYPYRVTLDTRPQDCDALGNINNVVFYSFFDSAVNQFLVEQCQLDYTQARLVPFVSSSQCQYIVHAVYPEAIAVGLRVIKMGRSSVTYGLSVYAGQTQRRVAHGQFVHVFIERNTQQAVPVPSAFKQALQQLMDDMG